MTEPQDPRIEAAAKAISARYYGDPTAWIRAADFVAALDAIRRVERQQATGERRKEARRLWRHPAMHESQRELDGLAVLRAPDRRATASQEETVPFDQYVPAPDIVRSATMREQPTPDDAGAAERARRAKLARDAYYEQSKGRSSFEWADLSTANKLDWLRVISALDADAAQRAEPDEAEITRLTSMAHEAYHGTGARFSRDVGMRAVVRAVLSAARPMGGEWRRPNLCDKIFDHKWLDPVCVEDGCRSIGQADLSEKLRKSEELADKYKWQVRDTCTRADTAEQSLATANAQIAELRLQLDAETVRANLYVGNYIRVAAELAARAQGVTAEELAIAMVDDQMLPRTFVEETIPKATRIIKRLAIPAQDTDRVLGLTREQLGRALFEASGVELSLPMCERVLARLVSIAAAAGSGEGEAE